MECYRTASGAVGVKNSARGLAPFADRHGHTQGAWKASPRPPGVFAADRLSRAKLGGLAIIGQTGDLPDLPATSSRRPSRELSRRPQTSVIFKDLSDDTDDALDDTATTATTATTASTSAPLMRLGLGIDLSKICQMSGVDPDANLVSAVEAVPSSASTRRRPPAINRLDSIVENKETVLPALTSTMNALQRDKERSEQVIATMTARANAVGKMEASLFAAVLVEEEAQSAEMGMPSPTRQGRGGRTVLDSLEQGQKTRDVANAKDGQDDRGRAGGNDVNDSRGSGQDKEAQRDSAALTSGQKTRDVANAKDVQDDRGRAGGDNVNDSRGSGQDKEAQRDSAALTSGENAVDATSDDESDMAFGHAATLKARTGEELEEQDQMESLGAKCCPVGRMKKSKTKTKTKKKKKKKRGSGGGAEDEDEDEDEELEDDDDYVDDGVIEDFIEDLFAAYGTVKDNKGRPLMNNPAVRKFFTDFGFGVCDVDYICQADLAYANELERQIDMNFRFDLSKGEAKRGLSLKAFTCCMDQVISRGVSRSIAKDLFNEYSGDAERMRRELA